MHAYTHTHTSVHMHSNTHMFSQSDAHAHANIYAYIITSIKEVCSLIYWHTSHHRVVVCLLSESLILGYKNLTVCFNNNALLSLNYVVYIQNS